MSRRFGVYLICAAAIAFAVIVSYVASGGTASTLLLEDGPVENLTAVFYGLAFLLAAGGIAFGRADASRVPSVSVALLALFFVVEEVSLGERILGHAGPRVLGIKLDAFHDLFHFTLKVIKVALAARPVLVVLLLLLVGGLVAWAAWRNRAVLGRLAADAWANEVGRFVALCLLLGAVGMIADLRSEIWLILMLFEELAELLAALALVFAAVAARGWLIEREGHGVAARP